MTGPTRYDPIWRRLRLARDDAAAAVREAVEHYHNVERGEVVEPGLRLPSRPYHRAAQGLPPTIEDPGARRATAFCTDLERKEVALNTNAAGSNALPREVVQEDRGLDETVSKASEALMHLRWHWTLDESNPERVSLREYARQVGTGYTAIAKSANDYSIMVADLLHLDQIDVA